MSVKLQNSKFSQEHIPVTNKIVPLQLKSEKMTVLKNELIADQ